MYPFLCTDTTVSIVHITNHLSVMIQLSAEDYNSYNTITYTSLFTNKNKLTCVWRKKITHKNHSFAHKKTGLDRKNNYEVQLVFTEYKCVSIDSGNLWKCVDDGANVRKWPSRLLAINPRYYPDICQIGSVPRQPSVTCSVITSERSLPRHPLSPPSFLGRMTA